MIFGVNGRYPSTPCELGTSGRPVDTLAFLGRCFYVWRAAFERDGEAGLVNKRPVARSHPRTTRQEVVEQVLHLRRTYHLGPKRIVWYLARYQGRERLHPIVPAVRHTDSESGAPLGAEGGGARSQCALDAKRQHGGPCGPSSPGQGTDAPTLAATTSW